MTARDDFLPPAGRQRIAVVGSGISGLAAAWLLQTRYEVTLFEADTRCGGHSHTVDVSLEGKTHPVDTGFLVFNERTYPNLIALFALLGIDSVPTEMSFAVRLQQPDLEWAGTSLATVFGQPRNLLRPAFWRMLAELLRFNRESQAWLAANPAAAGISLGDYLQAGGYGVAFRDWYLLPMAAAIWSSPTGQILAMPLATFVRFCRNHGLLQLLDRPQWRTVLGGSRTYVERIVGQLADVRCACPVRRVQPRADGGVQVEHAQGSERFDQVILACHSDQSLALLGEAADAGQREVLAAVRYQPNRAVLHCDPALLPRRPALWSAWNYLAGEGAPGQAPVGVSYLINRLQPLPFATPVVVTLNPPQEPAAERVIAEFAYDHPLFDAPAIAAQARLPAVQGRRGIWLAGAWGGYGFHEDGLKSALAVVNALGVEAPWQGGVRQPAEALA